MSLLRKHSRFVVLTASLAIYVYCLSLPALLFQNREALPGAHILAWGWWGIFMLQFAWFANLTYAFAVISYAKGKRAYSAISCGTALFLGLTSFRAQEWWFNEGGGTPIIELGLGFQVWLLSFLILLVGCAIPVAPNSSPNTASGDETVRAD